MYYGIISGFIVVILLSFLVLNQLSFLRRNEEIEIKNDYLVFKNSLDEFFLSTSNLHQNINSYVEFSDEFNDKLRDMYLQSIYVNKHELIAGFAIIMDENVEVVYPETLHYVSVGEDVTMSSRGKEVSDYLKSNSQPLIDRFNSFSDEDYLVIHLPLITNQEYYGMLNVYIEPLVEGYVKSIFNSDTRIFISISNDKDIINFGNEEAIEMNPLNFLYENNLGEWNISAVPENGWNNYIVPTSITTVLILLISILFGMQTRNLLSRYDESKEENKKLMATSIRDSLTGLYNRLYFEQVAHSRFSSRSSVDNRIALIYLDIDYFKHINDTYGHSIGDNILKGFAKKVQANLRDSDIFARWGGDEYIIMLTDTTMEEAKIVANKILWEIRDGHYGINDKITTSIGVVYRAKNEYYTSLFRRVDEALYTAKEKGRNRVEVAKYDANKVDVKIPWLSEWESGHRIIDEQHKLLTIHANRLVELYSETNELTEDVRKLSDELLKSVKDHFRYEVMELKRLDYEDYKEHEQIHKELIIKIEEILEEFYRSQIDIRSYYNFLLNEVVIKHLLEEDVKFFSIVNQNQT